MRLFDLMSSNHKLGCYRAAVFVSSVVTLAGGAPEVS